MSKLNITYFGAAAVELQTPDGKRLLIDPYINGNPFTTKNPADFSDVDLVLVTHAAFDHLGDTIEIMKASRARLIAGFEVCRLCEKAGIDPERTWLTIYGDLRVSHGYRVRTVQAKHVSLIKENEKMITGVAFGYMITTQEGICVYHPGDTAIFSDMKLYRELYRPQIMLVGVDKIAEPYPCEMTPYEAALATQWIGPDVVIPIHYPQESTAPKEFRQFVKDMTPTTQVVEAIDQTVVYSKFEVNKL